MLIRGLQGDPEGVVGVHLMLEVEGRGTGHRVIECEECEKAHPIIHHRTMHAFDHSITLHSITVDAATLQHIKLARRVSLWTRTMGVDTG